MELRTHGLELHLAPIGQADSEGWTHVLVEVRVSGFLGRYTAQLEVEDLKRFIRELAVMEDGLGQGSKAPCAVQNQVYRPTRRRALGRAGIPTVSRKARSSSKQATLGRRAPNTLKHLICARPRMKVNASHVSVFCTFSVLAVES